MPEGADDPAPDDGGDCFLRGFIGDFRPLLCGDIRPLGEIFCLLLLEGTGEADRLACGIFRGITSTNFLLSLLSFNWIRGKRSNEVISLDLKAPASMLCHNSIVLVTEERIVGISAPQ